jgi:hypothetical protein
MDNSYDFKCNTISINTAASQIITGSDTFIGAIFHNLDTTNTIYIGKSTILSGGENGFGILKGDVIYWRAEGNLKDMYAVAGGGTNLKLSYVLFK